MTTRTYESGRWVPWERLEPQEERATHAPLIVGFMLRRDIADAVLAVEREAEAIYARERRAAKKQLRAKQRPMRFNEATGRWVGGT